MSSPQEPLIQYLTVSGTFRYNINKLRALSRGDCLPLSGLMQGKCTGPYRGKTGTSKLVEGVMWGGRNWSDVRKEP